MGQHSSVAAAIDEASHASGYTITVNPQLQTEKYPLPRIDDIFSELAGGEVTKIEFRQVYHPMEVEEESQEYLTISTYQKGSTE